jgi:hypothetical protein
VEFTYTTIKEGDLPRPYLDVKIRVAEGRKEQEFSALVDSGADSTVFPLSATHTIGLTDFSGASVLRGNTAGGPVEILVFPIEICILGCWHRWHIGFSAQLGQAPLLGRLDFFRLFRVSIDERDRKFELLPHEDDTRDSGPSLFK